MTVTSTDVVPRVLPTQLSSVAVGPRGTNASTYWATTLDGNIPATGPPPPAPPAEDPSGASANPVRGRSATERGARLPPPPRRRPDARRRYDCRGRVGRPCAKEGFRLRWLRLQQLRLPPKRWPKEGPPPPRTTTTTPGAEDRIPRPTNARHLMWQWRPRAALRLGRQTIASRWRLCRDQRPTTPRGAVDLRTAMAKRRAQTTAQKFRWRYQWFPAARHWTGAEAVSGASALGDSNAVRCGGCFPPMIFPVPSFLSWCGTAALGILWWHSSGSQTSTPRDCLVVRRGCCCRQNVAAA